MLLSHIIVAVSCAGRSQRKVLCDVLMFYVVGAVDVAATVFGSGLYILCKRVRAFFGVMVLFYLLDLRGVLRRSRYNGSYVRL